MARDRTESCHSRKSIVTSESLLTNRFGTHRIDQHSSGSLRQIAKVKRTMETKIAINTSVSENRKGRGRTLSLSLASVALVMCLLYRSIWSSTLGLWTLILSLDEIRGARARFRPRTQNVVGQVEWCEIVSQWRCLKTIRSFVRGPGTDGVSARSNSKLETYVDGRCSARIRTSDVPATVESQETEQKEISVELSSKT